jgi:hypothetical protein
MGFRIRTSGSSKHDHQPAPPPKDEGPQVATPDQQGRAAQEAQGAERAFFNTPRYLREQNFTLPTAPLAILGIDPSGSGSDRTAFSLIQREIWAKGEPHDVGYQVLPINRIILAFALDHSADFATVRAHCISFRDILTRETYRGVFQDYFVAVEKNGVGLLLTETLPEDIENRRVLPVTTTSARDGKAYKKGIGIVMPRKPGPRTSQRGTLNTDVEGR